MDARILCKDPIYLRELSTICIKPLRIAFDHIGLRRPYETAIRYAHAVGLTELSNYMLYNFHDSPADLYRRMQMNIDLNEELDIRIFSFPMRYQPTDMKDRSFVGEKWNRYYLRSMQIILQATHGIVSGAPEFFRRAFGSTEQEFEDLLMRPQKFIFNRDWFEQLGGREEFEEYRANLEACSPADIADLKSLLVDFENVSFQAKRQTISNRKVSRLWDYYRPLSDREEEDIWRRQRELQQSFINEKCELPDDERIEDAGLEIEPVLH